MNQRSITAFALFAAIAATAQQAVPASGGNASGSGGSVSFTVGQVAYTEASGSGGSATQGVQHAYEIFELGADAVFADVSLTAYPNPTQDYLMLHIGSVLESLRYGIFDANGRNVTGGTISLADTSIDLSAMAKGIYILKLMSKNNTVHSFKIIKK